MKHRLHLGMLLSVIIYFLFGSSLAAGNDRQTYIIHMNISSKPAPFSTYESWHTSILKSLSTASDSINDLRATHLYTYNHVISGFSAVLSSSQLQHLKQKSGHLTAYPDSYGKLHTTHTPKFLGLSRNLGLWPNSRFGEDTIIGIIDSGIWPESESFNDKGMPQIPTRWKGKCETGDDFSSTLCNRKLIGARFFSKGHMQMSVNISRTQSQQSPRDYFGHGTHTSSTAAGSPVHGASYFGYAKGTMIGIAPKAHLAMYKVYFDDGSAASDVLVAMDQAIEDGVDLMSLSLGFWQTPYYKDVIAIGAFAAMEKGVFVSVSAGNDGPGAYSVINGAPWFTSIGAGTIDRDYMATVSLGDADIKIQGRSVYPENIFISNVTLYFGHGNISKESCSFLSLSQTDVSGKIVFCAASINETVSSQIREVSMTNAEGAIFATALGEYLDPEDFFSPFVAVTLSDGELIKKYAIEAPAPTVDITFMLTKLGTKSAPQVANFSSRGPSGITPWILKPDVLAPGVNVLASWAPVYGFAPIGNDYLITDYALVSGTSMSSPHVVGIAALLKSLHKDWSPAAIRSAMMTTADITDNTDHLITDLATRTAATPLDYGAGQVNPNKAMEPGLVYDIGYDDYIDFLCGLNYTNVQISVITRRPEVSCTRANLDLNYPSFSVILESNSSSQVFKRILTNISNYPASYRAIVHAPKGMNVLVEPQVLSFEGKNSKREFSMMVDIRLGNGAGVKTIGNYGFLRWVEVGGMHVVSSPIVSAFSPSIKA